MLQSLVLLRNEAGLLHCTLVELVQCSVPWGNRVKVASLFGVEFGLRSDRGYSVPVAVLVRGISGRVERCGQCCLV